MPIPPYRDGARRVGAMAMHAACGDDGDTTTDESDTVESSNGPIVIPTNPKRVVAMHDRLVAYAAASLGFGELIAVAARDAVDPAVAIRQFGEVPAVFDRLEDISTEANGPAARPCECPRVGLVVETGVDPVTFRFSGGRSAD